MEPKEFSKSGELGIDGLLILIQYELKVLKINIMGVASQFVMPVLYFIFIILSLGYNASNIDFHAYSISYIAYAFSGLIAILVISQTGQTIYRVVTDKRYGLFSLKRLSGIRTIYYQIGMSTYSFVCFLLQLVVLLILNFYLGEPLMIYETLYLVISSLIVLMFWTQVGVMLAVIIKNYQIRDNIISFILTPLAFSAPVFYSIDTAPYFMKILNFINPLSYQLDLIRRGIFLKEYFNSISYLFIAGIVMMFIVSYLISRIDLETVEK